LVEVGDEGLAVAGADEDDIEQEISRVGRRRERDVRAGRTSVHQLQLDQLDFELVAVHLHGPAMRLRVDDASSEQCEAVAELLLGRQRVGLRDEFGLAIECLRPAPILDFSAIEPWLERTLECLLVDDLGREYFWFSVVPLERFREGTDLWAIDEGYVS
jgi:hypothetical protein